MKNIPEGDIKEIKGVRKAKRVNIQFVVEQELDVTPSDTDFVGIDLGITNLAIFSNGKNIKDCKLNLNSLKGKTGKSRDHRKAKRWGHRAYHSARSLFVKESKTLREQELGFQHWLTSKIIKERPNLVVEQLQTLNMMKNHKLAWSKLEQKWGTFIRML